MTSEWKELELGDVAELIRGVSYKPSDLTNADNTDSVALLRATNIGEKQLELKEVLYVPAALVKSTQLLKKFDIVIAMSSGSRSAVGRLAQLRKDFDGTFGAFCGAIRPKSEAVDPEFLGYVLYSPQFRNRIDTYASGTAIMNLTKEGLLGFSVNLPPKKLQKKISDLLGAIDDRITLLRETNQTLEAIAQALFKSWFVDFDPVRAKMEGRQPEGIDAATAALFPDSLADSELGKIPSMWAVSTIGAELNAVLGGTPSRAKQEYWLNGSIPWINSGKVNEFRITTPSELITDDALKKSATKLLPARTTVLAITGATLGQISIAEISVCANQSVIGLPPSEKFSTEFIYFWINSNIQKLVANQTGGAQQHINKGNVEDLLLLIPEDKVLKSFQERAEPLFLKIAENCFQTTTLIALRDTLLPRLISGQLRIADAEAELEKATT